VFNNSTFEEVLVEEHYADPNFSLPLFKGNHYTILIRKEGYIAKRIEAFVDVEGCILCFEGLGSVRPGVTENLSRNNQIGVLLANVSLERAFSGKTIVLKDLYYDFGKAFLRPGAKKELNKLTRMMKDNPEIKVELGAHTDSRGDAEKNKKLSKRRAENAVKYLTAKGIDPERIISFGYGESQLRNECKDGVSCSEEKHSYNRRTELKFLDIVKSSEPVKSLKQMKMFDKAEKEMEELAFGGQVKIEEKDSDKKADKDAVDDKLGSKDKIDTPLATGKIKDIIYKVLIRESATALPLDDDLFKTHVDLVEVKTETGYKYLIGTYLEMDQIKEYYNNTVKVAYPESTIVKYGNGQIIE
jgi:outer membrane protein OmpA-like peptidoglycan-associated protein